MLMIPRIQGFLLIIHSLTNTLNLENFVNSTGGSNQPQRGELSILKLYLKPPTC